MAEEIQTGHDGTRGLNTAEDAERKLQDGVQADIIGGLPHPSDETPALTAGEAMDQLARRVDPTIARTVGGDRLQEWDPNSSSPTSSEAEQGKAQVRDLRARVTPGDTPEEPTVVEPISPLGQHNAAVGLMASRQILKDNRPS